MKKSKLVILILGIVFLILGITILIVGYSLAGYDIGAWFTTRYAYIVYVLVGAYLLVVISIYLIEWIRKL